MKFGKMIHDRRVALGLTLEQVGDACGVGKSTVRKWETGEIQNMRRDKLQLLANILRINPVDLILGEGKEQEAPKDDLWELRERLRRDPDMRMLFSAASKATPEHLRAAAAMLKALEPSTFPEDDPQEFSE